MERRFYIKFSGSAFDVKAETPEDAWKQIRDILYVYSSHYVQEIGKDCDELGYEYPKEKD